MLHPIIPFLRKLRLAEHASKLGAKIVFQIHSGDIVAWLGKKDRAKKMRQRLKDCKATIVCLSERWKELITPFWANVLSLQTLSIPFIVLMNPLNAIQNQILLLGRNDEVKGHDFAFQIMDEFQKNGSDLTLHCTGREQAPDDLDNVIAHGWVSRRESKTLARILTPHPSFNL